MRQLIIENKTGFQSILPFEIFEYKESKILFYSSEFTNSISEGKILKFNLPLGKYYYNGSFQKLYEPVKTKNIVLPNKERNYKPKKYKIIYDDNSCKCTIIYEKGLIVFDNSFKSKPLYIKYGIYFHELGHHFYKTEEFADLYSVKKMLEYGFNPSQIMRCFYYSLSEKSITRIEKIIELLTYNKG